MYRKRNLGCSPTFLHVVSLSQRLPNPGSQGVKPCLIRIMIRLIYISGELRDVALPVMSPHTGVRFLIPEGGCGTPLGSV